MAALGKQYSRSQETESTALRGWAAEKKEKEGEEGEGGW